MKFLIIAPRFHTNLYYRATALQDAGHEVRVVVLHKGKSEFYEKINIQKIKLSFFSNFLISIYSFFKKNKLKSGFELFIQSPGNELKSIIKNYNPDSIILKAYQNILAIKTLIVVRKFNIKVLMLTQTPHNHIKGSVFLFKLNVKLFKYLKVFAYITPIKSNYDAFKVFGIKNVFYLPFVSPQIKIKQIKEEFSDEIKIISVGKIQKRKDQIILLKAFNQLIKEKYDIKLCIIGELADEKYFKTLSNFINENLLLDKVCVKTNISYSNMIEEYYKYNIFILPAYDEPAAYSPVEAMANGLPVICSDKNGTKCYIEEDKNGFIFEAKNRNDLYNKIKMCISDREKLLKMKENALLSAKKNHNPKKFVNHIIQILSQTKIR